jgi:hypothetical protein
MIRLWLTYVTYPKEEERVFYTFKLFLPVFKLLRRRGGGGRHPVAIQYSVHCTGMPEKTQRMKTRTFYVIFVVI